MILPDDVIERMEIAYIGNTTIAGTDAGPSSSEMARMRAAIAELQRTHDIVERNGVPGLTHEEWLEARNALTKRAAVSVASQNPPETIGNAGCVSPNGINLAAGQVWSVALRRRKIVDFDGPTHTPISYRSNGSLYWTSKIEFLAWIARTGATLQEPT